MRFLSGFLLCAVMILPGCGEQAGSDDAPGAERDGRLVVHVVNYPLYYFAQRIGGDAVRVEFPAPPDVDPAFWMPDAETVAAYQTADLVLLNGAGYAGWVDRVTLPQAKLVDTSRSFGDRLVAVDDSVVHSHGPQGEHSHGATAFTTWLDPTLAVEQSAAIRDAFASARPDLAAVFEERFESLERDLLSIDSQLRAIVSPDSVPILLASHPVYQYLGRRYELDLGSVHFEPDEFPDEEAWEDLRRLRETHSASFMLWEGPPLERTATRLGESGVDSIVFDPCSNRPEAGDFLDVMRANVANLDSALSTGERSGSARP